ncbi:hypothetical protein Clacol_007382 [Clathrus columnatus]|uniref:Fungal lipase-type domain-containing protein n=1 Tax=Clathrus columnatus TaxID=1419009 RepID=A0AAV5AHB9_9AGAM|nr:hypothetical protein Clacol_007382 [Clathrus columnatus]
MPRAKRAISSPNPRQLQTAGPSDEIRYKLRALHADEIAYLSQEWRQNRVPKVVENSYTYLFLRTTRRYIKFLWETWSRALWSTVFLPTTFFDRLSIAAFSIVSSWIVFILLIWCLIANHPMFIKTFNRWSKENASGMTLINAAYPNMFKEYTHEQFQAAGIALAKPLRGSPNTSTKRVFNLDIAKFLLQCSALMYERTSAPLHDALDVSKRVGHRHGRRPSVVNSDKPGAILTAVLGEDVANEVNNHLHTNAQEDVLAAFASRLGIRYNTVSELNSQASAFCGIFWDPASTWIVLAFKGTTPTEFVEWTTDFSFNPRDVGHWIRGWRRAHGGFVDKIFPKRIKRGARLPYDTIREAIKTVSAHLLVNKPPDTDINVWMTGHSLGCALASLVYARQINESRELGSNVTVRDAYLFGAPILCDVDSVNAFNNRMNHDYDHPRTMWRITNGLDCVARSLPHSGDYSEWNMSPYNLFSYAHIGTEIQIRPAPCSSVVSGETHIVPGSHVRIDSALMANVSVLSKDTEFRKSQQTIRKLQKLPIIGRIVSHGTAGYWLTLNEVKTGACEWADS